MRYRLWKKKDGEKNFKPCHDCDTLKEAALLINGDPDGDPHKVWDFQAEGWVNPYLVFWECLNCFKVEKK